MNYFAQLRQRLAQSQPNTNLAPRLPQTQVPLVPPHVMTGPPQTQIPVLSRPLPSSQWHTQVPTGGPVRFAPGQSIMRALPQAPAPVPQAPMARPYTQHPLYASMLRDALMARLRGGR